MFKYKNDIESFVLRQGCSLRVYKNSDFTDSEYVFSAPPHRDLIIRDLEDNPATEYLGKLNFEVVVVLWMVNKNTISQFFFADDDIESLRCYC